MGLHDKHQYFYEKYLRNEMPDSERQAFEEKLSADDIFRKSFQFYQANRGRLLKELVEEDDQDEKRWRVHSWIYLLISVLGIALTLNYYFSRPEGNASVQAGNSKNLGLFDQIDFLKPASQKAPPPQEPVQEPEPIIIETTEDTATEDPDPEDQAPTPSEGVMSDFMLTDTFLSAYDREFFAQRYNSIRHETDSMLADSLIADLALRSSARNTEKSKPVPIFVEFWKSPVNFKGYKFSGKKLIIYGLQLPYPVYLLRKDDAFFMVTGTEEIPLTKDQAFHKF